MADPLLALVSLAAVTVTVTDCMGASSTVNLFLPSQLTAMEWEGRRLFPPLDVVMVWAIEDRLAAVVPLSWLCRRLEKRWKNLEALSTSSL